MNIFSYPADKEFQNTLFIPELNPLNTTYDEKRAKRIQQHDLVSRYATSEVSLLDDFI